MWESSSVSPSVSLEISWRRRLLYLLVVVVRMLEKKVDDMVHSCVRKAFGCPEEL
jgi:hypothetical protein